MTAGMLAAAAIGYAPPLLAADNLTGNKLYEMCTDPAFEAACDGYILGVADGVSMMAPKAYCMSPGVDVRQMKDVVVAFLEKAAAMRDKSAGPLVFWGLATAFSCKN